MEEHVFTGRKLSYIVLIFRYEDLKGPMDLILVNR